MKNLFNDISQEEKNRILEMHSGKKNVISEQSVPEMVNPLEMEKVLNQGGNGMTGIESIVKYCKTKNVSNTSKIDKLETMIDQAITGVENPLNLMGGAPGLEKVGEIIKNNVSNATELCSLLKHYFINDEDFVTAMRGEISTKLDSTMAADNVLLAIRSITRKK